MDVDMCVDLFYRKSCSESRTNRSRNVEQQQAHDVQHFRDT